VPKKSRTTRYEYIDGFELKIGWRTASSIDSRASKAASDAAEVQRVLVNSRNRAVVLPVDSESDVIEHSKE
jgi:hypothetical protein